MKCEKRTIVKLKIMQSIVGINECNKAPNKYSTHFRQ